MFTNEMMTSNLLNSHAVHRGFLSPSSGQSRSEKSDSYCWRFRNPAPVEVGSSSHDLQCFIHPGWLALGFQPSTEAWKFPLGELRRLGAFDLHHHGLQATCAGSSGIFVSSFKKKVANCNKEILLMEEILHHLGCIEPHGYCDIYYINWCRISSINTIKVRYLHLISFLVLQDRKKSKHTWLLWLKTSKAMQNVPSSASQILRKLYSFSSKNNWNWGKKKVKYLTRSSYSFLLP